MGGPSPGPQLLRHVAAALQCRNYPDQEDDDQRDREGETEHRKIDAEVGDAQSLQRHQSERQASQPVGKRHRDTSRQGTEHQALGQDLTGEPGPRFWKNGRCPAGREDHPVVGVSWHEAVAYARWVGKRLPTDAEWVKAGSWTVTLSDNTRVQRRYPWGEIMDRTRANLWGSGPDTTVPVNQFADGVSVGGVYHLIGNVWEWTRGELTSGSPPFQDLVFDVPLKSIRGGAFDTYFDNQATCQFQSGETAIARKRNIGFRCAVGACDVTLGRPVEDPTVPAELEEKPLEEVPA